MQWARRLLLTIVCILHPTYMQFMSVCNKYVIWTLTFDMIYLTAIGWHSVAVVQYTFTHKQYIEQYNRHEQYIEQHISLIRKSADRAPSLRVIPWHLPYNWGKSTEKPQSGYPGNLLSKGGKTWHVDPFIFVERKKLQARISQLPGYDFNTNPRYIYLLPIYITS
jgi:hypothetical protein